MTNQSVRNYIINANNVVLGNGRIHQVNIDSNETFNFANGGASGNQELANRQVTTGDNRTVLTGFVYRMRSLFGVTEQQRKIRALKEMRKNPGERHNFTRVTMIIGELQVLRRSEEKKDLLQLADCLADATFIAIQMNKFRECIAYGGEGVAIFETYFGRASKYRNYGWLLGNQGVAYQNMRQYSEAKIFYREAIQAFERCTEYAHPIWRFGDVKLITMNIKNIDWLERHQRRY